MFGDNLLSLRKLNNLSQEELAEKIDVTRQTLSKWEQGDALPDIERCRQLAEFFDVSIDELVSHDANEVGLNVPPRGKHAFGVVTVGEKGQIVIPAKARKIFDIKSGDRMVILGDEASGLAIIKEENLVGVFKEAVVNSMDN